MCGWYSRARIRISRRNRLRVGRGGDLGAEQLERDGPVVAPVMREVDDRRGAATELALDLIPNQARPVVVGILARLESPFLTQPLD